MLRDAAGGMVSRRQRAACSARWGRRFSPPPRRRGQMELAVIQGTVKDEAGKPLEGVTLPAQGHRPRPRDDGQERQGREVLSPRAAGGRVRAGRREGGLPADQRQGQADRRREQHGGSTSSWRRPRPKAPAISRKASRPTTTATTPPRRRRSKRRWRRRRTCRRFASTSRSPTSSCSGRPMRSPSSRRPRRSRPNNQAVQFQLGGAYVEMQSLDKAMAAFEKGLAIKPDPKDPLVWEAVVDARRGVFRARARPTRRPRSSRRRWPRSRARRRRRSGSARSISARATSPRRCSCSSRSSPRTPARRRPQQAEVFIKELKK